MKMRSHLTLIAIGAVAAQSLILYGQTGQLNLVPDRGLVPTATYSTTDLDTVNVTSGNLSLRIPLVSLPPNQVGEGFELALLYDSAVYDIQPQPAQSSNTIPQNYIQHRLTTSPHGGWRYNFRNAGLIIEDRIFANGTICDGTGGTQRTHRVRLALPDGGQHVLHLRGYGDEKGDSFNADGFYAIDHRGHRSTCAAQVAAALYPNDLSGVLTYYTADGSYIKFEIDASSGIWTAYFPDGSTITGVNEQATSFQNKHGYATIVNRYCSNLDCTATTFYSISDSSSRVITVALPSPSNLNQVDTIIAATAPGIANGWTITWGSTAQALPPGAGTTYNCAVDGNGTPLGGGFLQCPLPPAVATVTRIDIPATPTGRSYTFGYTNISGFGWGELHQMSTPLGSSVRWTYAHDLDMRSQTPSVLENNVLTRAVTHDGVTDNWNYNYTKTGLTPNTAVTDPMGAVTTHQYYTPTSQAWNRGLVYRILYPGGRTVDRTWAQNKTFGLSGVSVNEPNNPYIQQERVTLAGFAPQATQTALTINSLDKNGNLRTRTETDWAPVAAAGQPQSIGATLRQTSLAYTFTPATAIPLAEMAFQVQQAASDCGGCYWNYVSAAASPTLDQVRRREIYGPSGVEAVSEYYYVSTGGVPRGLVNQQFDWRSNAGSPPPLGTLSSANSVETNRAYSLDGSFVGHLDLSGAQVRTNVGYLTCTGLPLYPNLIKLGYGTTDERTIVPQYDCGTGKLVRETDSDNGGVFSTFEYDDVGREKRRVERQFRFVSTTYDDVSRTVTVKRDVKLANDGLDESVTYFDELGRIRLVKTTDGNPATAIKMAVVRKFISQGSVELRSPYREIVSTGAKVQESTLGWTCTEADALGRPVRVSWYSGEAQPSDCGAQTSRTGTATWSYNANVVTEIDAAQAKKETSYDASGRIVKVVEYKTAAETYTTTYGYNGRDLLTGVTQGSQVRSFTYDTLGRLIEVSNPEWQRDSSVVNGVPVSTPAVTRYSYYDHGGIASRRDGRWAGSTNTSVCPAADLTKTCVTATYLYDNLLRLTSKTYNDGTPGVTYSYYKGAGNSPNVGRLQSVSASDSEGTAVNRTYNYDILGYATSVAQQVSGSTYSFFSARLPNGAMSTLVFPSLRSLVYGYDDAGRPTGVSNAVGVSYAVAFPLDNGGYIHTAHGMPQKMALGNGRWEGRTYNSRLQTESIFVGTEWSVPATRDNLLRLSYSYNDNSGTFGNNGNVASQTVKRPVGSGTWTQSYSYDGVNRLKTMTEGSCSRTYEYDQWGNGYVSGNSCFAMDPFTLVSAASFDTLKNRVTANFGGVATTYDQMGNTTTTGAYTFGYDAEGRQKWSKVNGVETRYSYDGEGRRVMVMTGTGASAAKKVFVYDPDGRLAEEYSTAPANSGTTYVVPDALGSTRLVMTSSGSTVNCLDYLPFGEQIGESVNGRTPCANAVPAPPVRFTGKERDPETGLDHFSERHFSSAQGRWTSPDRPLMDQHAIDPQSWNLYSYVRNNPLRYIDPTGLCSQGSDGRMHDDDDGKCLAETSVTVSAPLEKVQTVPVSADPDAARVSLLVGMTRLALNTQLKEAAIIGATTYFGAAIDVAVAAGVGALARTAPKFWGPAFGGGPLPTEIASTFRSGTYTELVTAEETTLYRAYGGESRQLGSYWTRTEPAGRLQTRMDSALPPGNTAESVVSIRVPAGTKIFEGVAAPNFGTLGGGSQVYIPRVDRAWVVK